MVIDPWRPIVDPHHHLWDNSQSRYLLPDLLADLGSGHAVQQTIFVECGSMYRASGPTEMRPVGEVEFANGVAAMSASGNYGSCRAVSGIVATADLRLGDQAEAVLDAQAAAAGRRLRGIRVVSTWSPQPLFTNALPSGNRVLLADTNFRRGFSLLQSRGLLFEAWCYQTQLADVVALAAAFPQTELVLNHLGGPLRVGPYAGQERQGLIDWTRALRELARQPNVVVKVGGLGMPTFSRYFQAATPPKSEQLASDWRPWVETAIEVFGANRCMLESNFPVDKLTCDYRTLWNAFKRITVSCSEDEKTLLFSETARRVYGLPQTDRDV